MTTLATAALTLAAAYLLIVLPRGWRGAWRLLIDGGAS